MAEIKISTPLVPFYPCADRFCEGYKDKISFVKMFEEISKIKEIKGIELSYPNECKDVDLLKQLLKKYKLEVSNIEVDLFGNKLFKFGSLTSNKKEIRDRAVKLSNECIDFAKKIGCKQISLWLGQDGYDYPWQCDYAKAWQYLLENIAKIADYDKNINVVIEYKPREPRNYIFLANAAKCSLIFNKLARKNVGCLMDLGHSFNAKENPAEEAELLMNENKLYHVHINDNYGYWDDDLAVGTIHLSQTIEFFNVLTRNNYSGWYSFDIFPYREEGLESLKTNVFLLKKIIKIAKSINMVELRKLQSSDKIAEINTMIHSKLLK
jgi:xylose isomerase